MVKEADDDDYDVNDVRTPLPSIVLNVTVFHWSTVHTCHQLDQIESGTWIELTMYSPPCFRTRRCAGRDTTRAAEEWRLSNLLSVTPSPKLPERRKKEKISLRNVEILAVSRQNLAVVELSNRPNWSRVTPPVDLKEKIFILPATFGIKD
jgi:hypothetical protein